MRARSFITVKEKLKIRKTKARAGAGLAALCICLATLSGCAGRLPAVTGKSDAEQETVKDGEIEAVYLGVEDYGSNEVKLDSAGDFCYRFFFGGREAKIRLSGSAEEGYRLQNLLREGYIYYLTVEQGVVKDLRLAQTSGGFISGAVEAIGDDSVTLGGLEIRMRGDTRCYRVDKKAGGCTVTPKELFLRDYVEVPLYSDGSARTVYVMEGTKPYAPPVSGEPGVRTVKNLLKTAFGPVGCTLYMYEGGRNWQGDGASDVLRSVGMSSGWTDFFFTHDRDYTYKSLDGNEANMVPEESYYPYGGFNEYGYAGLDSSSYIGWTVYNTMYSENGHDAFLFPANKVADSFAGMEWGDRTQHFSIPVDRESSSFRSGDIFSSNQYVFLVVGTCDDGSILALMCVPSDSYDGQPGGGVQLAAIGESENTEAYRLAASYMTGYYPEWSSRYPPLLVSSRAYLQIEGNVAGLFSWNMSDGVLSDPDGYREMSPAEILEDLFDE